ncbi:MAG: ABC transporter permease subunit [Actinomycetota bacterium]|nr:ABC transporter permease subunit [Actinomycetota bacterium]
MRERPGVPALLRDVRLARWLFQLVAVALVVLLVRWLWGNVTTNSEERRIRTGWSFLDDRAGFPIPDKRSFSPNQPMREAFIEGLLNTLRLAVAGIVLATLLGILVGIARLSTNFLVRNAARLYVEFVRNVPLLAVITLTYVAIVQNGFPQLDEAWTLGSVLVLSNDVSAIPWYAYSGDSVRVLPRIGFLDEYFSGLVRREDVFAVAMILAAAVVAWLVARWRRWVSARTGAAASSGLFGTASFVLLIAAGWFALGFTVSTPEIIERGVARRVIGGMGMTSIYFAALIALVVYTSSHIAEIVRGSIQAVSKGQSEAADALALSSSQRLRYVVLPQAMRIAVPPLGNQYLNLTKNTSLAAIISYGELTKITELGTSNSIPVVPAYVTVLLIYLGISICISLLVNLANWRLKLVER